MRSLNKLGVLEGSAWKLRERVAEGGDTLRLHFEVNSSVKSRYPSYRDG